MSRASARAAMQQARQSVMIRKTPTTAVRVVLDECRGAHTVQLAEAETRGLAGLYYASGPKVSLDVQKLPELINGLQSLQAEARRLGLLPDQGGDQ